MLLTLTRSIDSELVPEAVASRLGELDASNSGWSCDVSGRTVLMRPSSATAQLATEASPFGPSAEMTSVHGELVAHGTGTTLTIEVRPPIRVRVMAWVMVLAFGALVLSVPWLWIAATADGPTEMFPIAAVLGTALGVFLALGSALHVRTANQVVRVIESALD